jgi:hypothetical protein
MSRRKWLALGIVPTLAFACIVYAQRRIDAQPKRELGNELLYLPNERLLDSFTVGMNSVVADLLWLRCIQYTSQEFRGDFKFTWLEHMLRTITRLDPYFGDVYRLGGVFLAMLKHDDDAGIDLLKRGIPRCPNQWELPFEIARTHILNRHDEVNGAKYLAMASATGSAPPFVINWAKNLQLTHDLDEIEYAMWRDILENNDDQNMKRLAQRKLEELNIRRTLDALNLAAERYMRELGRTLEAIDELQNANYIQGLPADPLGGRFFVDSGRILNTSLLDSLKEERLQVLRGWLRKFREQEGRWPAELQELKARGYAPGLPVNPYPSGKWRYDPATGEVG